MIRKILLVSLFFSPLAAHSIGCGNSAPAGDNTPFDTFQDCWDDHHVMEGFSIQRAIEICCIDHPIGGAAMNTVCGETVTACQTYVTANLTAGSAPTSDIATACMDYIVDRAG